MPDEVLAVLVLGVHADQYPFLDQAQRHTPRLVLVAIARSKRAIRLHSSRRQQTPEGGRSSAKSTQAPPANRRAASNKG